jgi:hypothetical protein
VLGIEADFFRILSDENEPLLFNPRMFTILNNKIPFFWVVNSGEDGEKYCYPSDWNAPGFFEDVLDKNKHAVKIFSSILNKYYPKVYKEYIAKANAMKYLLEFHGNLFRSIPAYSTKIEKVNRKSIALTISFLKNQKYCCFEPKCHFDPNWDKLKLFFKEVNKINVKYLIQADAYFKWNNKYQINPKSIQFNQIYRRIFSHR